MKRLKHLLKAIAPFVLIAIICICLTPHSVENDTYYLVKIGDYIWNHGIDFKDHYSWFADLAYTYPHFLFNLICFAFYSIFSWLGLYFLSITLYIIFGSSIFVCPVQRIWLGILDLIFCFYLFLPYYIYKAKIVWFSFYSLPKKRRRYFHVKVLRTAKY